MDYPAHQAGVVALSGRLMRLPIQIRMFATIIGVAALAIGLVSAIGGYYAARGVREQQEENLRRVVETLTNSRFPLSEPILRQMSGLSGADFVLFDPKTRIEAATLKIETGEAAPLLNIELSANLEDLSLSPAVRLSGRSYLARRVAVQQPFAPVPAGSLAVLYPEEKWWLGIREAAYPAAVAGLATVLVAAVAAVAVARRMVRPIRRLREQAARIAEGHFQPFEAPTRNDEIRDLAISINGMAEKLARFETQVRRSERLRTLDQLAAGMAHQLRNSATGARMAIELHQRECPDGGQSETLQVSLRQLQLIEQYLNRFLGHAPGARRETSLDLLATEVLDLVRPACRHARVELAAQIEPVAVLCDADAVREMLANVLLNAVDAARRCAHAGRIAFQLRRNDANQAEISVSDNGPGPPTELQERLFEPFVSGKPEGVGLGLYIARQIAESHGGVIRWTRQNGLTRFIMELPCESNPASTPSRNHGPSADC